MAKRPTSKEPKVTAARVTIDRRSRFNPMRGLTPDVLSRQIEDFDAGYLRSLALTMRAFEQRDYTLSAVVPKRLKAPGRNEYAILTVDDSAAAKRHKQVLEGFYNNLRATNSVDETERGGTRLLIRQMMHCIMPGYSVHEIVWNFHASREVPVTAEFRHVPLWFFEHRTSRLRYLESDAQIDGVEMEPGAWLTTTGSGVGIACCVAAMFKRLPLNDWLIYSERHGMPGFIGKTGAAKGSTEWTAMVDAVAAIAANFAAVVSKDDDIAKLETAAAGTLPYPELIERMDRAMAALLRGADLSTLSAGTGEGQGASVQGEETDLLEQDDCALISETLQEQVDRFVIQYALGDDTPLAYFELAPRKRVNVENDVRIDEFLIAHGARISIADAMQRYGRTPAADGDEALAAAAVPAALPVALPNERTAAADADAAGQILAETRMRLAEAVHADLKPVADRLQELLAQVDGMDQDAFDAAVEKFIDTELPALLGKVNATPELQLALEKALTDAWARGFADSAGETRGPKSEDRGPKSEDRGPKADGRDPKTGGDA
jgi:phage gp29-like protein